MKIYYIICMAGSLLLAWLARVYPELSGYLPMVVGTATFVLLAAQFQKELRGNRGKKETLSEDAILLNAIAQRSKGALPAEELHADPREAKARLVKGIALLFIYLILVYLFGFMFGSVVFLFGALAILGTPWLISALVTLFSGVLLYYAFGVFLKVPLFSGVFGRL